MKRDLTVRSPDDLKRLIPAHLRKLVEAGTHAPLYAFNRPDFDRVPIDTFLIQTALGTNGHVFERVIRVVEPNDPKRYHSQDLTDAKRLLYVCWAHGHAVRSLARPGQICCHHVVLPCDHRMLMVEAFKFACDHVRAMRGKRAKFRPTILYRALGITPPDWWPLDNA